MRVELKGLHKTSKILASGKKEDYYYAWKNGPRIKSKYGTTEFAEEFRKLTADRSTPDAQSFASIISLYKKMELPKRKPSTRRSYLQYIKQIEDEFGDMPIKAIEERGSRGEFLEWRNTMADRPRTADLAWSVLQKIMAYGVNLEKLSRNPCEKAGRLAETGTRREKIWTPPLIAKFNETASKSIKDAFLMAIWTGQRQGDLLRLTWSAYDGTHIFLKQSKTARAVTVRVSSELKTRLDARRAELAGKEIAAMQILTNERGKPWTSDGFRTSWGKALGKAKITGLTFHDLRGTFITNARRSGSSIEDIAQTSGHSINDVRSILEQHYLADDHAASDAVIVNMERGKR